MPYIKPGEVYGVQKQLVKLMEEFSTIRKMAEKGELNKETIEFLKRNAVTGEKRHGSIAKVNSVWVDVESAMEAEKLPRPIDTIDLEIE